MTNRKEYMKALYEAHKEEIIAKKKAYYQSHKEEIIAKKKEYQKAHKEERNKYFRYYSKADLNSHGQTKNSIRNKSQRILKQMKLNIPGYEIHHCFTYDDPNKFIYISKSLHLKIHQFLRDNNIAADSDHWMAIRDIVNATDEFVYIKA